MTLERAAHLVTRWVRFYTRPLPPPIAERRVEEICADVHDHVAFERAEGTSDRRIALSVLGRMVRGVADDMAWRWSVQPPKGDFMKPLLAGLGAGLVLAVLALIADSPLLILASIALIGGVILGAFALGVTTARRGDFVVPFVAILAGGLVVAAIGVTAIIVGDRGDAPGLVLFGVVLITSTVVGALTLGARTAQRSR